METASRSPRFNTKPRNQLLKIHTLRLALALTPLSAPKGSTLTRFSPGARSHLLPLTVHLCSGQYVAVPGCRCPLTLAVSAAGARAFPTWLQLTLTGGEGPCGSNPPPRVLTGY
ncbi:unnamed protein product [Pleuronectes platessa]|uniref:Uncharacterized protein n=1 Tax=Pleuronectes platessa TaxID=8262 RepID=A0A9N7VQM4_PLEPL|nr:unnamed protein product [Pleuronectes platessa]